MINRRLRHRTCHGRVEVCANAGSGATKVAAGVGGLMAASAIDASAATRRPVNLNFRSDRPDSRHVMLPPGGWLYLPLWRGETAGLLRSATGGEKAARRSKQPRVNTFSTTTLRVERRYRAGARVSTIESHAIPLLTSQATPIRAAKNRPRSLLRRLISRQKHSSRPGDPSARCRR